MFLFVLCSSYLFLLMVLRCECFLCFYFLKYVMFSLFNASFFYVDFRLIGIVSCRAQVKKNEFPLGGLK